MPTRLSASTTGTPEMRCFLVKASTSPILVVGDTVIGSLITPLSNFLTLATSRACCSAEMFLWITLKPPSCAKQMAMRASVTVSIAADNNGKPNSIRAVKGVRRSTSRGKIFDFAGLRRTSSKVRACLIFSIAELYASALAIQYTQAIY